MEDHEQSCKVTLEPTEGPYIQPYIALFDCEHLNAADMATYLSLLTYAGFKEIYPSLGTIAKRARFCVRTVIDSIAKIESLGLIKVNREGDGTSGPGRGYTNHYHVYRKETCNSCTFINKGAADAHQIDQRYISKKEGKPRPKKSKIDIDLTQDVIPWMATVAGKLPSHKRKLNGSEKALETKDKLIDAETMLGSAEFRKRWLDYLAGGAWKDTKWPYSHFLSALWAKSEPGADSHSASRPFKHRHKLSDTGITQADIDYARKFGKYPPDLYAADGSERTLEERTKEMEGWRKL